MYQKLILFPAIVVCGLVMLATGKAHAGGYGYCNSCYHQTYVQHEYVPQTIIEHQNVEQFFQVPNYVQQYAVTPSAIVAAKLGEAQRAEVQAHDRLLEMQQLYTPQQSPVQAQMPQQAQVVCYYMQPGQAPPPGALPYQPQQPAAVPPSQQPNPTFSLKAGQSIIQAACIRCHGGAKVEHDLDFTRPLTCAQKLDAVAAVATGEMPKGGAKFLPEQFVQFKKEIAALSNADKLSGNNEAE